MISVLIPVYNAEAFIVDTLESMALQKNVCLELLICDDASTDRSVELIEEFISTNKDMNIIFYKNDVNKGYLKTSNFLMEHASGQYVSFQDADDLAAPDRFDKLLNYLITNQLDLVGSYCGVFRTKNKILSVVEYSVSNEDIYNDLIRKPHPPFCGSAILVRYEVIRRCGLYDENFDRVSAEDFDWIFRVALEGFRMGNIPEPLYLYRQHSSSISNMNHVKNKLALFSEYIAKDLYLTRLNKGAEDFDFFKMKYLKEFSENPEELYYKNLQRSFLSTRFQLFSEIYKFLVYTRFSVKKFKMFFMSLVVLLFGFDQSKKLKMKFKRYRRII